MRPLHCSAILAGLALLAPRLVKAQPAPTPGQPAQDEPVVQMQNTSGGGQAAQAAAPAPTPAAAAAPSGGGSSPLSYGAPQMAQSGGGKAGAGEWKFDFHGYFRAPRVGGIGQRDDPATSRSTGPRRISPTATTG